MTIEEHSLTELERVFVSNASEFSKYASSDEILSEIEHVFSVNLSRSVDANTYDDIKESLERVLDDKAAIFLVEFTANSSGFNFKSIENILPQGALLTFLRKLTATYGVLMWRARQTKYYPNEWIQVFSNSVADPRRGFMIRTVFKLGTGQKVLLISPPDNSVVLAEHLLRNIINTSDFSVEDSDGKKRQLIDFLDNANIEKLEASLTELKKIRAKFSVPNAQTQGLQ
jgi:hypothetical protein